mmetsp:Transcript_29561/g.73831  ORF Transcript_29561/g.73831 Transcript_29561/m.73831 type:complete len:245 (-) Transcript_29561:154-888(-)
MGTPPADTEPRSGGVKAVSPSRGDEAYWFVMASISVRLAVLGRSDRRRCNTPASRVAVWSTDAVVVPRFSTLSNSASAFIRVSLSAADARTILSADADTARLARVASRQARTISRTATRNPAKQAATTAARSATSASAGGEKFTPGGDSGGADGSWREAASWKMGVEMRGGGRRGPQTASLVSAEYEFQAEGENGNGASGVVKVDSEGDCDTALRETTELRTAPTTTLSRHPRRRSPGCWRRRR